MLLDEGITAGDAVGIQLPNTVEIAVAFLAIVRIGAIVTPFPVQYRAYELTRLSHVAQVKLFITAGRIGQRQAAAEIAGLREQIPSLRTAGRVRSRTFRPGVVRLDARIAAAGDRRGLAAHLASFRSPDPERLRDDLLDLGHGKHPQGRASGRTTTGWPCAPPPSRARA